MYHTKISLINDASAIFSAYKIIKKERPHVIHCHSAKGGIIGRIVGRLLGINVLYTPHAFSYLSAESKWKRWFYLLIEKQFANINSISEMFIGLLNVQLSISK